MSIAKAWPVSPADEARFWRRVIRSAESDDCWGWSGAFSKHGYPVVRAGGNSRNAHRVSCIINNGPFPVEWVVDHLCRNITCCNPRHLEAVPQRVNVLRGAVGFKTECKYGHPLDGFKGRGKNRSRYCRTCHNARLRARLRASKLAEAAA